jgi:NADH:ubiquinone reductase (non-electrogenic)
VVVLPVSSLGQFPIPLLPEARFLIPRYSGELHDFLEEDLKFWYPELASRMKITLVEALPSVLPMFSKALIEYTESTFKEAKIDILTKTMVKEVKERGVVLQMPDKSIREVPCGMVVWAAVCSTFSFLFHGANRICQYQGNTLRALTKNLMAQFPSVQTNRRGLTVDGYLRVVGADGIFALGDCTATSYAPTAQVASQQGAYLAKFFNRLANKENLLVEKQLLETTESPEDKKAEVTNRLGTIGKQLEKLENPRLFQYSHQGSLAYIGSEKAIADLPFMNGTVSPIFFPLISRT